jgi:hypothetical protein
MVSVSPSHRDECNDRGRRDAHGGREREDGNDPEELLYVPIRSAQSIRRPLPMPTPNLKEMIKSVKIGAPKLRPQERQSPMPFATILPFSFMTKEETEAFFAAIPADKIRIASSST